VAPVLLLRIVWSLPGASVLEDVRTPPTGWNAATASRLRLAHGIIVDGGWYCWTMASFSCLLTTEENDLIMRSEFNAPGKRVVSPHAGRLNSRLTNHSKAHRGTKLELAIPSTHCREHCRCNIRRCNATSGDELTPIDVNRETEYRFKSTQTSLMMTALICTIPRSFEVSSYGCRSCFVGLSLFVGAGSGGPSSGPTLLRTLAYGDAPPSNLRMAL
jgi:hypothetical protein